MHKWPKGGVFPRTGVHRSKVDDGVSGVVAARSVDLQENGSVFFECFPLLCLSRACLGKVIVCILNTERKVPLPSYLIFLGLALAQRPASGCRNGSVLVGVSLCLSRACLDKIDHFHINSGPNTAVWCLTGRCLCKHHIAVLILRQRIRCDVLQRVCPSGPLLFINPEDLRVAEEVAKRSLSECQVHGWIVRDGDVSVDIPQTLRMAALHRAAVQHLVPSVGTFGHVAQVEVAHQFDVRIGSFFLLVKRSSF